MNFRLLFTRMLAIFGLVLACGGHAFAEPLRIAGSVCTAQPAEPGEAVEPQSGRKFYLEFPCDLQPGEKVNFILSMHGAGGTGARMRNYFPTGDYLQRYRLVVATPTSATTSRIWNGEADDVILQRIVDLVFENFGKANIKTFWLAGHSQGGITATRLVCTPFFANKADGLLSMSGGRIGKVEYVPDFFGPRPPGVTKWPPGAPDPGAKPSVEPTPSCDFSFIFTTGEKEITGLPETSPLAQKFACGARVRKADIVDTQPKAGTSEVFEYSKCGGGRLVADMFRRGKSHGDGILVNETEALLRMMLSAPSGKVQAK